MWMTESGLELVKGFADQCDKLGLSAEGTALRGPECDQMAKKRHVSPQED